MDTIIKELIACDRQAQEQLAATISARDQAEAELPQEGKRLYDDFLKRADKRVVRMEQHLKRGQQGTLEELEQRYAGARAQLESTFAENRQRWCQELFDRCITLE